MLSVVQLFICICRFRCNIHISEHEVTSGMFMDVIRKKSGKERPKNRKKSYKFYKNNRKKRKKERREILRSNEKVDAFPSVFSSK